MRTEKDFLEYLNTIKQMAAEEGYDSLDETFVEHERCRFFGQDVVIGRTERIVLREMKMADLEAFYGFTGAMEEPVLQAFLKENSTASEEHFKSYLPSMYPLYDYGMWTVEDAEKKEILGICGLGRACIWKEGEEVEVTDLGYYLRPESRGQGLALEAADLTLAYAKDYLELQELYALVTEENRPSVRFLEKIGFSRENACRAERKGVLVYKKEFLE
jgi:RimJ/RimL family protein N-acetyltransferase